MAASVDFLRVLLDVAFVPDFSSFENVFIFGAICVCIGLIIGAIAIIYFVTHRKNRKNKK